jgi:alpha-galactosidase
LDTNDASDLVSHPTVAAAAVDDSGKTLLPAMKSTVLLLLGASVASAASLKTGTPILGWNSYNKYGCNPTQTIIQTNAKGLVTLGLSTLGYVYVTPDCGWNSPGRDSSGQLIWNKSTFPAGGAALGSYIHGLGLKFGVYSGGGYYQCGSTNQPASLGWL